MSRWRLVVLVSAIAGLLAVSAVGVFWQHFINSDDVRAVVLDGDELWAGTHKGGLLHLYDVTPTSASFERWTVEDGLPTNSIYALAHTTDQLFGEELWWLGTEGLGLHAFEPTTASIVDSFTTADSDIPSDNVRALLAIAGLAGSGHELWVGTDAGLAQLQYFFGFDAWTVFTTDDGLPVDDVDITSVFADAAGMTWFGSLGTGVIFHMDMVLPPFSYFDTSNSELPSNNVNAVARSDQPGLGEIVFCGMEDYGLVGLWVQDGPMGSAGTIARYPPGDMNVFGLRFNSIDGRPGLPSDRVLSLEFDDESNLWIGTDAGAARWWVVNPSASTITLLTGVTRVVNDIAAAGNVMIPDDTIVYLGTDWRVWSCWRELGEVDYAVSNFEYEDQIPANYVPSVHSTADGSYEDAWVATEQGVSWFDGTGWTTWTVDDGLPATPTVVRPNGTTIYIGTEDGLAVLDSGTGAITVYSSPPLPSSYINDVEVSGAEILVATDNGGAGFLGVPPFSGFLIGYDLTSIAVDDEGEQWFGTNGDGLFRGTSGLVYDMGNSDILSDFVRDVAAVGDNIIYVATDDGVSRLDKDTLIWTDYQTPDLLSNDVRCIAVDPQGLRPTGYDIFPFSEHVLFGTPSGVSRLFRYTDVSGFVYAAWSEFVYDPDGPVADSILSDNVFAANVFAGRLTGAGFPDEFTISWFGHDSGASYRAQGLPLLSNGTDVVSVEENTSFDLSVYYEDDEGEAPVLHNVYLADDNVAGPYDWRWNMSAVGPDNPGTWRRSLSMNRGRYFFYYYFVDDDYTAAWLPAGNGYYNGIYCHDQYEPDNTCDDANFIHVLRPGDLATVENHSLIFSPYDPDSDWYETTDTLTAGWYYRIWTHNLDRADTDIAIWSGPDCGSAVYETGATGDGGAVDIWWECGVTQTHYIMVVDGHLWTPGTVPISYNYDLAIAEYEVDQYEPDEVCDDAVPIDPDCVSQRHTLAPHDDVDWLTFDALQGISYRVFTFDIDPYITDPDIYVYYGDCGSLTLIGSDDAAGLGESANVEFFCETTGTYYIEVRHHTPGEIGSVYHIAVCSELWPMVGCDKGHKGYINADGPTTNKVEWARTFGQYDLNAYIAMDQTCRSFVAATDGTLYAVLPNGRLDWGYQTGTLSGLGPVIDHAGNAVLPLEGGGLISITPDGALNWAQAAGPDITAPPTVGDDGVLYFGLADTSIQAIDAPSGNAILGYPFTPPAPVLGPIVGSPAIDSGGRLYFTTAGNVDAFNVFCVNPGPPPSVAWRAWAPPWITTAAPTLSHDEAELYVGGLNGVLYAKDTSSGADLWNFTTAGPIVGSPAVHPAAGLVYIPSEDGVLYCVDPADPSAALWQYPTGGPIHSSPAVDLTGRCYFGSDDGFFYCLNPDGTLLWSYDFVVPVDSSPSLDSYGFVYITVGHELFVFDEWVPDPRAPESTCDCPNKVTDPLIPVTWVCRDNKSGVKSVALWYRYSPGDVWSVWLDSGLIGYVETGTFDFVATAQGIYEFYTIAEDYAGNVEDAPATADCSCIFNTVFPDSSCTSPEYDDAMPIPVQFTSDAVNGIFQTVLWYRYDGGAWTCSGLAKQATAGTIYFGVNRGDGTYDFYSVAMDAIGNEEPRPDAATEPDTTTIYDTHRPVSSCWLIDGSGYTKEPVIPIEFRAYDGLSGVLETTLYYRIGSVDWVDSGLSMTGLLGTFEFDATATGEGQYEFTTVAADNAGNKEFGPNEAKASVIYDETAPDSTCTLNGLTDTEILLDYTVSDGNAVTEVQLWYRLAFREWTLHPVRGSGSSGMFTFVPMLGDGTYEFYTIAIDAAGNVEARAALPDALSIYFDVKAPASYCTGPALTTSNEIQVAFHVVELNNGIKRVKLYQKFNDGEWIYTGLSRSGKNKGVFDVRLYDGDGTYGFHTIAEDWVGNVEDPPDEADAITLLDRQAPTSECSSNWIATASVLEIGYQAQDAVSGVNRTKLFSSYNGAAFTDTGLVGYEPTGTFAFTAQGDGEYAFYTIAVDEAGHRERVPDMPDAVTILDTQAPFSECMCPSLTNATEVTVTYLAGDERPDTVTVSLWYAFNTGAAIDTGLSLTANTGAFDFELTRGEGVYSFFTLATDTGGNLEPDKDFECTVLYDATAPISTCSSDIYANRSPLSVVFSAEDPDVAWSVDGSGVRGTSLWYRFKRYIDLEFGDWQDPGVRMELDEGTFSLWAKEGEGFYDLQTRADDRAGNLEALKDEPDCSVIYDVTPPSSFCSSPPVVYEQRIEIDYNVYEITSGLDRTTLWYKYEDGEFESTRITRPEPSGQIVFRPRDGQGTYYFYTISVDNAGNVERAPLSPDCETTFARNEPDINVEPMSIDFGVVPPFVPQGVSAYVEVSNVGLLPLIVSDVTIESMSPAFNTTAGAMTVQPGVSQMIEVSFLPPGMGQFNGTLVITSNDPDEPEVRVPLTGSGQATVQNPSIQVTPPQLAFGSVTVGQTDTGTFTVTNVGGAELTVYSVQNEALGPSPFSDANGAGYYPFHVPPGGTTTIRINFTPTAQMNYSTNFIIYHNDFGDPAHPGETTVSCTGTGVGTGGGPDIDLSADAIDFGQMVVNGYEGRELSINNVGSADLSVSRLEISGTPEGTFYDPQHYPPGSWSFTVEPGGSQMVALNFHPPSLGVFIHSLNIYSNDPDEPVVSVELRGEGVSGTGGPDIDLCEGDSIDFGTASPFSPSIRGVTVCNVGDQDLNITGMNMSDPMTFIDMQGGGVFGYPITVAPGDRTELTIMFLPLMPGEYDGWADIVSLDPDEPLVRVTLTGTGEGIFRSVVSVSADKSVVRDGDELSLSLGIEHQGPGGGIDLLGAVVLPDGTFLFYPGFSMDPQPVFLTLEENAALGPIEILRARFSNALPKGTYSFYAAALNPYNYDMQIEGNIASTTWVFE